MPQLNFPCRESGPGVCISLLTIVKRLLISFVGSFSEGVFSYPILICEWFICSKGFVLQHIPFRGYGLSFNLAHCFSFFDM